MASNLFARFLFLSVSGYEYMMIYYPDDLLIAGRMPPRLFRTLASNLVARSIFLSVYGYVFMIMYYPDDLYVLGRKPAPVLLDLGYCYFSLLGTHQRDGMWYAQFWLSLDSNGECLDVGDQFIWQPVLFFPPTASFMTRKKRNSLMHALNGNTSTHTYTLKVATIKSLDTNSQLDICTLSHICMQT
jgi:hypothetical protein